MVNAWNPDSSKNQLPVYHSEFPQIPKKIHDFHGSMPFLMGLAQPPAMDFHVALLSGQSCHVSQSVATGKQLRLAAQKALGWDSNDVSTEHGVMSTLD